MKDKKFLKLTWELVKDPELAPDWFFDKLMDKTIRIYYTDKIENSQSAGINTEFGTTIVNANDYIVLNDKGYLETVTKEALEIITLSVK